MTDESTADDGAIIDAWQGGLTDADVAEVVAAVDHLALLVAAHRRRHPGQPFPVVAVALAMQIAGPPMRWGFLPLVAEVLA